MAGADEISAIKPLEVLIIFWWAGDDDDDDFSPELHRLELNFLRQLMEIETKKEGGGDFDEDVFFFSSP